MSVKNMTAVFEHSPYSATTRLVHLAMADACNDDNDNLCWMSLRRIAHKAHCSMDSVTRAIKQMVADGYLDEVQAPKAGVPGEAGQSGIYQFIAPTAAGVPASCGVVPANEGGVPANAPTALFIGTQEEVCVPAFDQLWAAYPTNRHGSKQRAATAFKKVAQELPAILTGLKPWRAYWDARNEPEFIPYLEKFLNWRRWEEEPPPLNRANGHAKLGYMSPKSLQQQTMIHSIVQGNGNGKR